MRLRQNSDWLRLLPASATAAILTLAAACNSAGCLDNGTTLPLAGFYDAESHRSISVSTLEIRGLGAPGDSVLLSTGVAASDVYLPMRASAENVSWIFDYTADGLPEELNDTVVFSYQTIPYFASEACGAMYVYRVRSVEYTRNVIDSIALLDSLLNNVDAETIHIYFGVAEEGEEQ